MHVLRLAAAALVASLALAACGGSGALLTPAPPGAATASPIATSTAAATSLAATPTRPALTPAPQTPAPPTSAPATASASGVVIGDVCAMFTVAELEALTGHTFVGMTTDGILAEEVGCIWSFESPTPGITWDLVLSFLTVGARVLFEESEPFAATGTALPDLGVENYPSGGNIIYALKGDVMVTVQYVNLSDDANREQVPVEVMRRALATLP